MSNPKTDGAKLEALIDALSDSVLEASDDVILDELRLSGVDPETEAGRLKTMMLGTVKTFRQRSLEASRAAYDHQIKTMDKKEYPIPLTMAECRKMFSLFVKQPQFKEFVTAQYRNLEDLTDADIKSYLEDLAELGILDQLDCDETNG